MPKAFPREFRDDVVAIARRREVSFAQIEQHDEWEAGERRYFPEASMLQLKTTNQPADPVDETVILPELTAT